MKRNFIIVCALLICLLAALALRPLPAPTEDNCRKITGTVEAIEVSANTKDVNIHLVNDDDIYYINRGVQAGLTEEILNKTILNREVELSYIKHWTPLDPFTSLHHIASLYCEGKHIYSEVRK